MDAYLGIVENILTNGKPKHDRTGTGTIVIDGATFRHDMSKGFPLVTTKTVYTKAVLVELEFFIRGLTDKRWLQERGCTIWNEWANPEKAPYGNNDESKRRMAEEKDLGPVYGFQWRHFGADYSGCEVDYTGKGIDQLESVIERLRKDPSDRRAVVSSWNPMQLHQMALAPCHFDWQLTVTDGKLNLFWTQRSVDTMLGLPFNIASYGTLLHLIAKELGYGEGILQGNLGDTHIYSNHIDNAKLQLGREPRDLPYAETEEFSHVYNWKHGDTRFKDYNPYPNIKFPIAV